MIQSDFPRYARYTGIIQFIQANSSFPAIRVNRNAIVLYPLINFHEKKCHFLIKNTYHNLVGDDNKWHSKPVQESENYVCVCVVYVLAHALSIPD